MTSEAMKLIIDQLGHIMKTQVDQMGYSRVEEMYVDQVG